ncbi:MAG: FAD-binding oxidoreductase [Pirellulaceae bacterium]
MSTTELLPITETLSPDTPQDVVAAVKDCFESETPVYAIGGGTSLGYGLPAKASGVGLSLGKLNRVVDYPARDMTITVEAGITMQALKATLAAERQQLPIDVPHEDRATLGGVVATNFTGPRRYGYGNVRDYVIGVTAVDGRGTMFKGGGRVVKNVAGYDFCKLLTGSLGTLGVITQLTMKLKPLAERSALVVCPLVDLEEAERILSTLAGSRATPSAIELLDGPYWHDDPVLAEASARADKIGVILVVGLEGTAVEVAWMLEEIAGDLRQHNSDGHTVIEGDEAAGLWRRLAEFPAGEAALTLKINVVPSAVTRMLSLVREIDRDSAVEAQAGSGVLLVRFPTMPTEGISRTVVGKLQPAAAAEHGHVVLLANPSAAEMTHQSVWGGSDAPYWLMTEVKRKFDPAGILNPERFVYQ